MPIPAHMSRPMTARPREAQNSHQTGPRASARPPTRKATMITDTDTQEIVRPWKEGKETGVPGTWDTNGTTCSPPTPLVTALPPAVPVLAPAPGPLTDPLAELAVADPACFAMRAAPLLPLVVYPYHCGQAPTSAHTRPRDTSHRPSAYRRWPPASGPVRPAGSVSPQISPTMAVAGTRPAGLPLNQPGAACS